MNVFNRIVMLILGLVLLVFGGAVFLLLGGLVVPSNPYLRSVLALYAALQVVARLRGMPTNLAVLAALIIGLIGLVLVILELLPIGRVFRPRRETKQYLIRHDDLGQVTVNRATVRDFVQHEAEATGGVTHAEVSLKDGAQGLIISTNATLAWNASAPAVGQQLQERLKDTVQTRLGLPVAEVKVTAQAAPFTEQARHRVA